MNFIDYCIDAGITVRDAMKAIDHVDPKIVFLVEKNKLIASLTDGDLRRFLLNCGQLTDLAVKAANRTPRYASNSLEAASMYHRKHYVAIPIINNKKEIIDIFIGRKVYGKMLVDLNIPVVINAGGKGTRLEPYTKILPKPLIPVGEYPIIEHIMQEFKEYGCNHFHMIVNYKKEIMKAYFAENDKEYNITWYDEKKPLGTGGGLCYLKGKLNDTFFFTNCDNLLLTNYESILNFHRVNKNTITMVCAYKNIQIPYGVIEMGLNGSIESMREKPEFSFLTNTGIYIVEPEILNDIKENVAIGFPDIIDQQIAKGRKVSIYPVSDYDWLDMGQMTELENMRKRLYGE